MKTIWKYLNIVNDNILVMNYHDTKILLVNSTHRGIEPLFNL